MKVLVTAASKHGATHEIAEHIAEAMVGRGLQVELHDLVDIGTLAGYDAILLGSAVYAGSWRKEAIAFAESHGAQLREVPVWLFSSGPLGEEAAEQVELNRAEELMEMTGAKSHTWFHGRLDKDQLSLGERAVVKMVMAPYGDFRNWDEIEAWAGDIADELAGR